MKRRGSVALVVALIIVVVLVVAGGVWYYATKKISSPDTTGSSTPNNPAVVPTAASTTSSNITASSTSEISLVSNFLKNDPTAQGIAAETIKNYSIETFNYTYGKNSWGKTNNFAFRVVSALRMLGYTQGLSQPGGVNPGDVLLNKFQRLNGFPVSSIIDATVLGKIDAALAIREKQDATLAAENPMYGHFVDAPLNEPTSDHIAAIWTVALKSLPSSLVVWSSENIENYIGHQLQGTYKGLNTPQYEICDISVYMEYTDGCQLVRPDETDTFIDDFTRADTIIHEYAHYLDGNLFPRQAGTSEGIIDTTSFYNISYNTSDKKTDSNGWVGYTLRRPDNIANEFVGDYAEGWQLSDPKYRTPYEDFAESFAFYVTTGKAFRAVAKSNPILQQKYDWLKNNVFGGMEYQSGEDNYPQLLIQNAITKKISATDAYNIQDFTEVDPDFVWNYGFIDGSKATL